MAAPSTVKASAVCCLALVLLVGSGCASDGSSEAVGRALAKVSLPKAAGGGGGAAALAPSPTDASRFVPVRATRLHDTGPGDPLPAGRSLRIPVAGRAGIPARPAGTVTAVVLQVAVSRTGGAGAATLWPSGTARPAATQVSFGRAGDRAGALVTVRPGRDGAVLLRLSTSGQATVDAVGYFTRVARSAAGRYVSVVPARVATLDTKRRGPEFRVRVADGAAAPRDAVAVVIAVEATVGRNGATVRVRPEPRERGVTLAWPAPRNPGGPPSIGLAIVRPDEDGRVFLRYAGGSLATVDVLGYFTGASAEESATGLFVPVSAGASRAAAGVRLSAGGTRTIHFGEMAAGAVVATVSAADGAGPVTVRAAGGGMLVMAVRVGAPRGARSGLVLAPVGEDRALQLWTDHATRVWVDVAGFFLR